MEYLRSSLQCCTETVNSLRVFSREIEEDP